MQFGLVSVITPCYNTGKYLPNLLDSVLGQSYPSIEMIAIDDGSTDMTAEVIESYIPKFLKKGFSLTYVWQENSGQSAAIQRGLDMMNGEFFVWPDSDDYYASSDAIAKMVERMKASSEDVAMVRTQEVMVKDTEEHKSSMIRGMAAKEIEDKTLFEDCLYGINQFYYCPGPYMIKTQAFINSSKLPIYISKDAGQNWQLMLPVLYHYRCSTILEPLYHVVQRSDSHSRAKKQYPQLKHRIETYRDTILNTLKNIVDISPEDLEYHTQHIKIKYAIELLNSAIQHKQKAEAEQYYSWLLQHDSVGLPLRIKWWLFNRHLYWVWHYGNSIIMRIKNIIT